MQIEVVQNGSIIYLLFLIFTFISLLIGIILLEGGCEIYCLVWLCRCLGPYGNLLDRTVHAGTSCRLIMTSMVS